MVQLIILLLLTMVITQDVVNGAEISHSFVPEYNKFILRCTVAPYVGGVVDEILAKVGIYPVYELGLTEQKEISYTDNFNLGTATGMCTHAGMMVLWGVDRVPNTLSLVMGTMLHTFHFHRTRLGFLKKS